MFLLHRALLAFASVALASFASALTTPAVSFEELVDQAASIHRTEVTGVRAEWRTHPTDGPYIETIVTFKVRETLKGAPTAELQLEQLGGRIGDTALNIPGLPIWTVGDCDYLFVSADRKTVCPLVGLPHGRFWVLKEGGEEYVARANGSALVDLADLKRPICVHTSVTRTLTPSTATCTHGVTATASRGLPLTAVQFATAIRDRIAQVDSSETE